MHARHLPDVLNPARADNQRGIHRQIVGHGSWYFGSVGSLFCQFASGYAGRSPDRRGRHIEDQPLWSMAGFDGIPCCPRRREVGAGARPAAPIRLSTGSVRNKPGATSVVIPR
jgi:hypothetical protein